MKILEWTLQVTDMQILPMPVGAKLLAVQTFGNLPQLWALVDEGIAWTQRCFRTYKTGNPMPDEGCQGVYVGTYQIESEAQAFHVFETPLPLCSAPVGET